MPLRLHQNLNKSPNFYIRGTVTRFVDGRAVNVPFPERSTGTACEATALAIKSRLEAQLNQQNFTGEFTTRKTFGDAAAHYLKCGGSGRFLDKVLDQIEQTHLDALDQAAVDAAAVRAYPNAAPATRRRQFHSVVSAVTRKYGQPILLTLPPQSKPRLVYFRPAQVEELIRRAMPHARFRKAAPPPWRAALITFLVGQGTRMGETLSIDARDDLFMDYGYAVLRDTKTDAERVVWLQPRVKAALSRLPNIGERGPLFRRQDGQPYADRDDRGGQLKAFLDRTLPQMDLDPRVFTAHVTRHTWATWHFACERNLLRLRNEGGWTTAAMPERYAKIASPGLADEVRTHRWEFPDPLTLQGKRNTDEDFIGPRRLAWV